MQVFIGLDGGGSGCRAVAELPDGQRSAILTGGPANVSTDKAGALAQITALLAQIETAVRELGNGAPLAPPKVVLGLAGALEADAAPWLCAALPYADITVLGDIEIALTGAFGGSDGLVVVVGTGSALACRRGGQMRRVGGYGLALGDEASGAWIGRAALGARLLALDGLGPDGPLVQDLGGRYSSAAQIIAFSQSAQPADYATFAPLVLEHAQRHCPVAGAILDSACAYLRRAIAQAQRGGPALPVAALGGLGPALLARMQAQGGTGLRVVPPQGSALDGALWHARHGTTGPAS